MRSETELRCELVAATAKLQKLDEEIFQLNQWLKISGDEWPQDHEALQRRVEHRGALAAHCEILHWVLTPDEPKKTATLKLVKT